MKILDKQEYRLKTEQMLKLAGKKSYKEAMEIADSIDWSKVKNTSVLCAVSEIYEANGEFQKGRELLLSAYERATDSKKIIYRLGLLAVKLDDVKEATECYEEFLKVAPKDPNRFVLQYRILKAKNASLDEQIEVLEELKKAEYTERWAYELAKLYKEAGRVSECLEECDDVILWFSEGKFVYKAMELKMQYKPLTPLQREKYENRPGAPVVKKQVEEVPVVEKQKPEPETVEEPAEVPVEEPAKEPAKEPEVKAAPQETKPLASIEEMVQEWQAQQKENAQMIQAKLAEVEAEKVPVVEEKQESILPDDIRKLMEELEAESADIDAQKLKSFEDAMVEEEEVEKEVPFGEEENKPLLQKVVEQLTAMEILPEKKTITPDQIVVKPVEEIPGLDEPVVKAPVEEALPVVEVEVEVPEEEESIIAPEVVEEVMTEAIENVDGIKLGDTQSIALSTKALASAAKVEAPIEEVSTPAPAIQEPVKKAVGYDTGFIVQGRYDLEVQSEIGLRAGLTEEQKKLFSYFVPVHGMSEQLVTVLENDRNCKSRYGTSRIGNVLVIGRQGSGKTVLAVDIVKAIQKQRRMKQGKVAIVEASALNAKDVPSIVSKLHGGALIIEVASELERKTVDDLCEAMEGQTGELLVVLEDERKPLAKLLEKYPNFKKKFTSQVEIPVFINDELVTFGQTYAKENGYKIDEMGILALYSRIDLLQREEKAVTVADVKEVVDEAIDNANSASVKKLMKKMFGKNKDDANRVLLTEEDFR